MPTQTSRHENRYASLIVQHEQLRRRSQAMWQLLKSKLDVNDDELRYALARIEHSAPPEQRLLDCSVCRHPVQSTAKCCLYCGTAPLSQSEATRLAGSWHPQH